MKTDYSTYARTVLSYSESLAFLIRKYSLAPAETRRVGEYAVAHWTLLTEMQIDEALLNPQNSIHLGIKVYGTQLKNFKKHLDMDLQIQEQMQLIEVALKDSRERYAKSDPQLQNEHLEIIQNLEAEYKKLAAVKQEVNELLKELPRSRTQLNEENYQKDEEWENFRKGILKKITQSLLEHGMPLTEHEKMTLELPESMTEVLKRFKVLHLEIPSYISIKEPDFYTYFELKTYLAIHASLGRRMLPHTAEDIQKWQQRGDV